MTTVPFSRQFWPREGNSDASCNLVSPLLTVISKQEIGGKQTAPAIRQRGGWEGDFQACISRLARFRDHAGVPGNLSPRPYLRTVRPLCLEVAMSRMRAVQVNSANGPFELVERDVPEPGPRAVRID